MNALAMLVANHEKEGGRGNAALMLGRFGEEARSAIPHLLEGTKASDPRIRRTSAMALFKIAPEAARAAKGSILPVLIETLAGGSPEADRVSENLKIEAAKYLSSFDALSESAWQNIERVGKSTENAELREICNQILETRPN